MHNVPSLQLLGLNGAVAHAPGVAHEFSDKFAQQAPGVAQDSCGGTVVGGTVVTAAVTCGSGADSAAVGSAAVGVGFGDGVTDAARLVVGDVSPPPALSMS